MMCQSGSNNVSSDLKCSDGACADWTFSPEEEAAVAPKGWNTSSSGGWVDDSAAAAGNFFDRAPRSHKQAGSSGWSESSPALDNRWARSLPLHAPCLQKGIFLRTARIPILLSLALLIRCGPLRTSRDAVLTASPWLELLTRS